MSMKSRYKTNPEKVRDGTWFEDEANSDGTVPRVRLRRSGFRVNPAWAPAVRKHTRDQDVENLTDEQDNATMGAIFGEACVVEWENMQPEDDGVSIPFSTEAAVALLSDPAWFDLLADWQDKAGKVASFQDKAETEAGN